MKIFGIGLSRTGTTSLSVALAYMGFKTAHYSFGGELIGDTAIEACEALTDTPIAARFEELDSRYVGARFIYTVREKTSWLDSCQRHFVHIDDPETPMAKLRIALFGAMNFDATCLSEAYDRFDQRVRAYFANRPQDLLIFDVIGGHGWEELCSFVGKAVPRAPFPRENAGVKKWTGVSRFHLYCEQFVLRHGAYRNSIRAN